MDANTFSWLLSELNKLKNEYKYLELVNGYYDARDLPYYMVYFNCNFCGNIITFPVSIPGDYVIDAQTIEIIKSAFIYYYNAYEKYFT